MKAIEIDEREISFLKRSILKKINKEKGVKYLQDTEFNSNPNSYIPIVEYIGKKKLNTVTTTFMRDLFYSFKDGKTVRSSSIDKIYQFLFSCTREIYLRKFPYEFQKKPHWFYSIVELTPEVKKTAADYTNSELRFYTLPDRITFLNRAKRTDRISYVYIDDSFLKSTDGVLIIIDLFCNRFIPLLADYNIQFILEEDLFDTDETILNVEKQIEYLEFWRNKEEYLSFMGNKELISKLYSPTFIAVLKAIKRYSALTKNRNQFSVDQLLLMFQELSDVSEEPLKNIYTTPVESNASYLCIMGHEGYSSYQDKPSVLKYIKKFGEERHQSTLIRIFTLPAKKIKGRWLSQLNRDQNTLLNDYIKASKDAGFKSYVLCYDESLVDERIPSLWNQGYIIKHVNNEVTSKFKSIEEFREYYAQNDLSLETTSNDSTEVYFSLPSEDRKKKMIRVQHEIYVHRIFEDFIYRCQFLGKNRRIADLIDIENDAYSISRILRLNRSRRVRKDHVKSDMTPIPA